MDLTGTYTDTNPPFSGTKNKWKFTNKTGEKICDLRITVDGPWYADLPDIEKVTIKDASGNTLTTSTFPNDISVRVELAANQCIDPDQTFEVIVETEQEFESGEAIQFAPSDADGASIIAADMPISSAYLASATRGVPEPVWDVLTLAGFLPFPWTAPITAIRWLRWLRRLQRAGRGLRQAPIPTPRAPQYAPGASYRVQPDDSLKVIAWKVLHERLGREPKELELQSMIKRIDRENEITAEKTLKPGDEIIIP